MFVGKGRCACEGVSFGKAVVLVSPKQSIVNDSDAYLSVDEELVLFHTGLEKAKQELTDLITKAQENLGSESAKIFEVHLMMLEDPDIYQAIEDRIKKGAISAVYATHEVGLSQAREFEALDDEFTRQRASDIKDVTNRIIHAIEGTVNIELTEPSIIVADDLLPSQTLALNRSLVLGLLLRQGTQNSHATILARNMSIPMLLNAKFPENIDGFDVGAKGDLAPLNGHTIGLNAMKGEFYIDPTDEDLGKIETAKEEYEQVRLRQLALKGKPCITPNGHEIRTSANISLPDDVELALENDAKAIGLFRTEFLFLGRNEAPSEEEQYKAYARVVSAMEGKTVVIRTLDIGADKRVNYLRIPHEDNPALGLRALRFSLRYPEFFKVQLRAIYRAAALGKVAILLPLVSSVSEIERTKLICKDVEQELTAARIDYKVPVMGIMIETPAAALLSSKLAQMVDFFSVGTNDLLQYTTACDRQNKNIGEFVDPHHEAMLELLKLSAENAHKAGIPIAICGELAADPTLTDFFIENGFDELSVSPNYILSLRERILQSQAICHNELKNPRSAH